MLSGEVIEQLPQRLVGGLEAGQELGQRLRLGVSHSRQRIQRCQDDPLLILGEGYVSHRHRRLLARQRQLDTEVAIDDVARRLVDEDLGHPAHFRKSSADGPLLVVRVAPPVARILTVQSRSYPGVRLPGRN